MRSKRLIAIAVALLLSCVCALPLWVRPYAQTVEDTVYDDFTVTRLENSNVYESNYAVGVANSAHALLPADRWGEPVNAGSGYVVYKLSTRRGYKIKHLNLTLTAKISNLSNAQYNGNNLKIYYSTDGIAYNIYQTIGIANGIRTFDYTTDVTPVFDLFVKFEMNNYKGELPLNQVGVKIYSIGFTYTQEVTDQLRETDKSVLTESFTNIDNFSGEIFKTDSGVGFSGNGYYKLPLSLDTGVEFSFDDLKLMDHAEYGCWLSFSVLSEKKAGNYLNRDSNGMHFMLFVRDGQLMCNAVFTYNDAQTALCNGMVVGKATDKSVSVRISRKQNSKSRAVVVEINGFAVSGSLSGGIMNYKLCGEGRTAYLGFGALGSNENYSGKELHSAVIKEIAYTDIIGPQITVKNLKESYAAGVITLPEIVITDSGSVAYKRIRLFSPEGKRIVIASNKVSVSGVGKYLLLVEAEDDSGNTTREQFYINVI